jgi:hypothetical protein
MIIIFLLLLAWLIPFYINTQENHEQEPHNTKKVHKRGYKKATEKEENKSTETHYYDEETGGMISKKEADAAYDKHMEVRHKEIRQKKLNDHIETIKQMKNGGRHKAADEMEKKLREEFGEQTVTEELNKPTEEGFGYDEF